MKRRKVFLMALCALLLPLVPAGCGSAGGDPAADGAVEVDFWNGFSGPDGKQMEAVVKRFNAEHKGKIRVRMQIIPWGTFYDKVTLGLAFGGAPEVFVLHVNRFPEFASHGVLGAVDDLVARGELPPDDFVPAAWRATFWQDQQYAVPLDVHPLGLFYNLDLFEKAGIRRPPETYEEFLDAARKLTVDRNRDGRPEQWGFAFTWLHSNSYQFLNQFGASLLTPDLQRSGLRSPEAEAAMRRMTDIIAAGVAPRPEGQDAWLGFQTGKVAMALEGVYMMAGLKEQKHLRWAAAPVPQFGPKRAVWAGSHLLTIPASLPEPKREAAWTFIRYLSDQSLDWAEGGQVPARKSLLATDRFRAMTVQAQFARQLEAVVYEPASVKYNLVATFGDSAFEAILNGTSPPKTALTTASRRIDNVMERK